MAEVTPIERAARALAKAQSGTDEWDAYDEAFQENLKEQARAVLCAVREPSKAMKKAGALPVQIAEHRGDIDEAPPPVDVWQAMLDKAAEE